MPMGVHPRVYMGIGLHENAVLYYPSERKRLIDTMTYLGLALKGIAAVGPSLDIWGQLDARVTVSGNLKVGATYKMKPVELYFPNQGEVEHQFGEDLETHDVSDTGLEPRIEGGVRADVDFNVHITPEVDLGIKIGGKLGGSDRVLADAHVAAFVNTTLNFHAKATAEVSGR